LAGLNPRLYPALCSRPPFKVAAPTVAAA
jgi:hypothetical protein